MTQHRLNFDSSLSIMTPRTQNHRPLKRMHLTNDEQIPQNRSHVGYSEDKTFLILLLIYGSSIFYNIKMVVFES